MNLFQDYDDPLQMVKEKILFSILISFRYVYIASGEKKFFFKFDFSLKIFFIIY